jgi:hypothetical protein
MDKSDVVYHIRQQKSNSLARLDWVHRDETPSTRYVIHYCELFKGHHVRLLKGSFSCLTIMYYLTAGPSVVSSVVWDGFFNYGTESSILDKEPPVIGQ